MRVLLAVLLAIGLQNATGPAAQPVGERASKEPTVAAEGELPTLAELERALADARAELERERREAQRREAALRAEVLELKRELARVLDERLAREREWLGYSLALQGAKPDGLRFEADVPTVVRADDAERAAAAAVDAGAPLEPPETQPDANAADDAAAARARRAREVFIALQSLLIAEEVTGLDLLEVGNVVDGWTGPVVMRVLDEWGRPLGSITAERLRFEGSRAARTVTLVLENGHERRMGELIPFQDAAGERNRRIVLPHVDPAPWMRDLPELFDEASFEPPADDGRWDLGGVRASLNELLRLDAANGWYRVRVLGGVQGSVLRNVMLEELDRDDRLERRLFADRVEIVPQDRGVMLLLSGGAQERSGRKTPFLDGRYRIFLPRADVERWTAAQVPGLVEPPPRKRKN